MSDGVNPQAAEREHASASDPGGGSAREEPSGGAQQETAGRGRQQTAVDPAMKDQPAECGREEAEDRQGRPG